MKKQDAEALAASLDIDLHRDGVCLACLTFVAFPLDEGDTAEAARAARYIIPTLWGEGLDRVARRLVQEALDADKPHAAEAVGDLEARGMRSAVVRAIVFRLAEAMVVDMHAMWERVQAGR